MHYQAWMETCESIWCLSLCWRLISAIACGPLSCFKPPVVALLQRRSSFPFFFFFACVTCFWCLSPVWWLFASWLWNIHQFSLLFASFCLLWETFSVFCGSVLYIWEWFFSPSAIEVFHPYSCIGLLKNSPRHNYGTKYTTAVMICSEMLNRQKNLKYGKYD